MRAVANEDIARQIAKIILDVGNVEVDYQEDFEDGMTVWFFECSQGRRVGVWSDGSLYFPSDDPEKDGIVFGAFDVIRLMFPKKDKGRWISAAIMEMVSAKEYTQDEISKRLNINSYHAVRSLYLKGKIGKRRKNYYETREEAAVKYHRYATPEWYKANGITDYLMHEDGREHAQTS